MKKKVIKSSPELRFDELTVLIARLRKEKCEATVLMGHFVSGNLDRTLTNLEAVGYWKPDSDCSVEELQERRLYGKPWYILGKYMDDLERVLKPAYQSAGQFPKDWSAGKNAHVL